jgi:hypothetical protein
VVARCGLAWDRARPWAKRLSWQAQGGRVKYPPGWEGENRGLFEHPSIIVTAVPYIIFHLRLMYKPSFSAGC